MEEKIQESIGSTVLSALQLARDLASADNDMATYWAISAAIDVRICVSPRGDIKRAIRYIKSRGK